MAGICGFIAPLLSEYLIIAIFNSFINPISIVKRKPPYPEQKQIFIFLCDMQYRGKDMKISTNNHYRHKNNEKYTILSDKCLFFVLNYPTFLKIIEYPKEYVIKAFHTMSVIVFIQLSGDCWLSCPTIVS